MLNQSTILLSGIGLYILKLFFRKDNSLENMELKKISELSEHRFSFYCMQSKPLRDNTYMIFLGSYMTNSRLYEFELFNEPVMELSVFRD
jgi:hypothetical protein